MKTYLERLRLLFLAVLLIPSLAIGQGKSQEPVLVPDAVTKLPREELGSYERNALQWALELRKLRIEKKPEGKRIGELHIINLDVFGKAEGFLRYVNFLHITTREHVIAREVLLQAGDDWDEALLTESIRRVKDPLFTSLVVMVPVKSSDPDKVDVLVVTRDVWSLRANSIFEVFQGTLTGLRLSVAENNIVGLRKHGAFVFDMDLGKISIGPQYIDKALWGTRLKLNSRFRTIFSRKDRDFEGTSSHFSLNYPLWSLREKWGGDVRFSHFDAPVRVFQGTEVQLLDNPDTSEVEEIARIYRDRRMAFRTSAVRSIGKSVKQQFTLGHEFSVIRPKLVEDFSGSVSDEQYLRDVVFPRSERASSVFLQYRLFTPDFVVYRNLNSFDLAEDVRLGPELTAGVSTSLKAIGSQRNFYNGSLGAAWTVDIAEDGFVRGSAGVTTRLQGGELIDNFLSGSVKVAVPSVANIFRLVAKVNLKARIREKGNAFFQLGGDSGLRGYVISEFQGQKQFLTNVELRSTPAKIGPIRAGVLAFWDMGHVADRLSELTLKHGVGLGLRSLIPQLQPIVFRFDWAFPLESDNAGFPGRFSAGVSQVF
ncbi:MAG: BamA/TamA family outer membrane protein [Kofleriaceae bacterium]|nr:BamA/TamA family outer membrane protein [Kofleriaceae bacterium]